MSATATDLDLDLDIEVLSDSPRCQSTHKHWADNLVCSGEVVAIAHYACLDRSIMVCENHRRAQLRRMNRRRYPLPYHNLCGNPTADCWSIRPI